MNRGAEQVILDVLYALPIGAPLSQDAPAPGCELRDQVRCRGSADEPRHLTIKNLKNR